MMNMEQDFKTITDKISAGTPLCFARFNDGEADAIENPGITISRGDQYVSEDLVPELKTAAMYRASGYWIGMPCPTCKPKRYEIMSKYVPDNYPFRTLAVLFVNQNWTATVDHLFKAIGEKPVWIVAGENQDWSWASLNVQRRITTPAQNAWASRSDFIEEWENLPPGAVVLLSCGPLSRVMAYYWYYKRPDCTMLDIGSCFDPWTQDIQHRYQKIDSNFMNQSPYCSTCNRTGKKNK